MAEYCKRCGRAIGSKESIKRGYGSTCFRKIMKEKAKAEIEKAKELEQIEGQMDLMEASL